MTEIQHEVETAIAVSVQRNHYASIPVLSLEIGKILSMCSGLTKLVVWFRTSVSFRTRKPEIGALTDLYDLNGGRVIINQQFCSYMRQIHTKDWSAFRDLVRDHSIDDPPDVRLVGSRPVRRVRPESSSHFAGYPVSNATRGRLRVDLHRRSW